ncbi:MAG: hypothetical protein QG566_472 [Patescibacteria group bacterium]|nr:hypothetical protein [Patescibacteria group bacterium]
MQDQIGTTYQIVTSIIGIVGGIVIIVYRKKFLELQKKHFSKHKDFLNKKILEGLESKSEKSNYTLTIIVAVFIIILSVIQLINII